jgi:two-component system sensor histidine kinase/response regulator
MDKPNLLIVDDEDGPRQSLRIVFKQEYNVHVASSGPEALQIARQNPINVVVCDILMSGMSGVEVLKALKDIDHRIEVIMLTAYETLETARQALRLGASDYLNKPFDIPTMRAAVAKAAAKHSTAVTLERTNTELDGLQKQINEQRVKEEMERTKGEIYASVLHDINSPLTVISGFVDLINQSMQDAAMLEGEQLESLKGDLQHLTGEVARCVEISRRYLRFLNREAEENMSSNVQQILSDLRDLLRKHPSTRGHELSVQQLDQPLQVRINGTDLLQILLNLTFNALQSTDQPHEVTVEFFREPAGVDLSRFANDEWNRFIPGPSFDPQQKLAVISVHDTGPGIQPQVLSRMFEEQFTTKPAGKGTGLGLSIVNRLVKNAGGAIQVKTQSGAGSSFTVFLPIG